MSLKQEKKVGKESSKTKKIEKIKLPHEQLLHLSIVAKNVLFILQQTSEHIDQIVQQEKTNITDDHCEKFLDHQKWAIQSLGQLQGLSSALKVISNCARWELFEKIEPPLNW